MKNFIYILFFLNFNLFSNYYLNNDLINREVINSHAISHSGSILLSDILQLSSQIRVNTIDGFSWYASINGLDTFDNQNWIIILDNHKLNLNTFDIININFLPININEIDSIEVIASPNIYKGLFTDSGLIHIHTKNNNTKNITTSFITGNESGDPGAYANIEGETSPNVENIGTITSLNLKFNKNKNYYTTGFYSNLYSISDWALQDRIINIHLDSDQEKLRFGNLFVHRISTFLKIDRKINSKYINFYANYIFSDHHFLYFKPLGMEIPTKYKNGYLGLNFTNQLSNKSNIIYKINYSFNQLTKYPNNFDFDFNYNLKKFHASIENNTIILNSQLIMGMAFERLGLSTKYNLDKPYYDIYKFFSSLNYKFNNLISNKIDGMIIFSNNKYSLKSSYSILFKIKDKNKINFTISYLEKLFNENTNLWYWQELGYDLLNINYLNDINFKKNKVVTVDIAWKNNFFNNMDITYKNYLRSFQGINFENYSYKFNSETEFITLDSLSIYNDESLVVAGLNISFKNSITKKIQQFFSYDVQLGLCGTEYLRNSKNKIPIHSLKYQMIYTITQNFSFWIKFNHLSNTIWKDYEMIDGSIYENIMGQNLSYSNRVNQFNLLDIGFQKWFLDRKIKTNISLRNILNQNYRYHPVGATFDLSLFLEVLFYPI